MLVVASCVLAAFMALCAEGLIQAFQSSAAEVQRDKMQALVYALLGAAEAGEGGTLSLLGSALPDPRLSRVDSGLSALIFNDRGNVVWRSRSFTGDVPDIGSEVPGQSAFTEVAGHFTLSYGVRWAAESNGLHLFSSPPKPRRYTVMIMEDDAAYQAKLEAFRHTLWIGFGSSAAVLLLVQLLVLNWGLSPLRKLTQELRRVETGDQARILGSYPTELTPLADGLNAMLQNERSQQTRYRNALGDLAHSLKTPLAVLRGVLDSNPLEPPLRTQFEEPLRRVQDIAEYQLKRAGTVGRRTLSEPVAPRPIVEKTLAALAKVYADKGIQFANEVPPALRLRVDSGDMFELFGNLSDNAAKWCKKRVRIAASVNRRELLIEVEDDGPGFPEHAENLLERGVRADSRTPGQGIGLATVADIVASNEGRIELGRSATLGGGKVSLRWPV